MARAELRARRHCRGARAPFRAAEAHLRSAVQGGHRLLALAYVQALRIEEAKHILETTMSPVEASAAGRLRRQRLVPTPLSSALRHEPCRLPAQAATSPDGSGAGPRAPVQRRKPDARFRAEVTYADPRHETYRRRASAWLCCNGVIGRHAERLTERHVLRRRRHDDRIRGDSLAGDVRNLQANPRIEVNFVDPFVRKGYRFAGTAKVLARGEGNFDALLKKSGSSLAPRVRAIVLINVTKALPLVSPAYDDGTATEDTIRKSWTARFRKLQPGEKFEE